MHHGGVPSPLPTDDPEQAPAESNRADASPPTREQKRRVRLGGYACGLVCLCLAATCFVLWARHGEECASADESNPGSGSEASDRCLSVLEQDVLLTSIVALGSLGIMPLCLLCPCVSRSRGVTTSLGDRTFSTAVSGMV